jgi:hypothetical protein
MCEDLKYYYSVMDGNYDNVNEYPIAIQKFMKFYKKYDNSSNSQTPIITGIPGNLSVIPNKTAPMGCYKLIEKHGDKMTADSQIFEFDYYYYYPNKGVGDDVSTKIKECNEIIKTSRDAAGNYHYYYNTEYYDNVYKDVLTKDYKPPGKIKMEVLEWVHTNEQASPGNATPELYRAMDFFKDYGEQICKGGKEYIPHVFKELNLQGDQRSDGQGGYSEDGWFITDNEDDNELLLGVPIRRKCYFLLDHSAGGFVYGYVEFHDHLVCVNKIISDNVIEDLSEPPPVVVEPMNDAPIIDAPVVEDPKRGRRVQQGRRRKGGGKSKTSKKRKNTKRRKNIKKKSSKKKRTKRRRRTKRK